MPSPLYASMVCIVWHSQMRRMKTQMQTTTRKMAFAGSIIQRLCVDHRVENSYILK